jgi:hypothetical protein
MLFKPNANSSFSHAAAIQSQFLLQVRVSRTGEASYAQLGMSSGATNGFDARYDSNLPPGFGGLQVAVQNSDQRFTDVRAFAAQPVYRVNASGCEPGKKYSFSFFTKSGRATQIIVKDIQTGKTQTFGTISGAFGFTASKSTMAFDVTIKGAR